MYLSKHPFDVSWHITLCLHLQDWLFPFVYKIYLPNATTIRHIVAHSTPTVRSTGGCYSHGTATGFLTTPSTTSCRSRCWSRGTMRRACRGTAPRGGGRGAGVDRTREEVVAVWPSVGILYRCTGRRGSVGLGGWGGRGEGARRGVRGGRMQTSAHLPRNKPATRLWLEPTVTM